MKKNKWSLISFVASLVLTIIPLYHWLGYASHERAGTVPEGMDLKSVAMLSGAWGILLVLIAIPCLLHLIGLLSQKAVWFILAGIIYVIYFLLIHVLALSWSSVLFIGLGCIVVALLSFLTASMLKVQVNEKS